MPCYVRHCYACFITIVAAFRRRAPPRDATRLCCLYEPLRCLFDFLFAAYARLYDDALRALPIGFIAMRVMLTIRYARQRCLSLFHYYMSYMRAARLMMLLESAARARDATAAYAELLLPSLLRRRLPREWRRSV